MVITIDGPAGAGKSTVARQLAERLDMEFLDTGAMYRCVALAALEQGVAWDDPEGLAEMARGLNIGLRGDTVRLNGRDVTAAIRHSSVTAVVHHAADHPEIRQHLVQLQREAARERDIVTEGRDQGTVVFPDAECKFFLTASAEERAKRRLSELRRRGEKTLTLNDVLEEQAARDQRDRDRPVGRLVQAADAIPVCTDGLTLEQVVRQLEEEVARRLSPNGEPPSHGPT